MSELPINNPNLPANHQDIGNIPSGDEGVLTIEELKEMPIEHVFAEGMATIPHPWERGFVDVKWYAIRGVIHDWAIYHSFDSNIVEFMMYGNDHAKAPKQMILDTGAKLHDMKIVESLVPATPEALEMYRH